MTNTLNKVRNLFTKKELLKTFTYFIPAPPQRKIAYREKQFDGVLNKLVEQGLELRDIKTQSSPDPSGPGLWIICTFKVSHKDQVIELPGDLLFHTDPDDEIEGFYTLEDKKDLV